MLEVVRQLRNSVEIAILTNNTGLVADHIDFLCPELRPLFNRRIYTSAKFNSAKPDVVQVFGRRSPQCVEGASSRRPKTCTKPDSCTAANIRQSLSHRLFRGLVYRVPF